MKKFIYFQTTINNEDNAAEMDLNVKVKLNAEDEREI